MAHYLKNDEGLYLKEIDSVNTTITFTESTFEAKTYNGDWFADTELEYVKFHFKDKEEVKTLHAVYE